MTASKSPFFKLRRWLPLLLALLGIGGLGLVDSWFKVGGGAGYCPADATWTVVCDDFPEFWRRLNGTDALSQVRAEWPRPEEDIERRTRKRLEIRPTPIRWDLWLGRRLLVAGNEDGTGICVRPGILARVAHRMLSIRGSESSDGIHSVRGIAYAWRDGFLIASESPAYVAASLQAESPVLTPAKAAEELRVIWIAEPAGSLVFSPADGLPIWGHIDVALTTRDEPLRMIPVTPETVLTVTTSQWRDLRALGREMDRRLAALAIWPVLRSAAKTSWNQWQFPLPEQGWEEDIEQSTLVLAGFSHTEALPVPRLALIQDAEAKPNAEHPLKPLTAGAEVIPFEWGGRPGLLMSIWGEHVSLCLGRREEAWLATTDEALMRDLAAESPGTTPEQADVAIYGQWQPAMEATLGALRDAAEWELLPKYDPREAEQVFAPIFKALSRLGHLEITGTMNDNHLQFAGHLAGGIPEATESGVE
jgi:hypothetical protein